MCSFFILETWQKKGKTGELQSSDRNYGLRGWENIAKRKQTT